MIALYGPSLPSLFRNFSEMSWSISHPHEVNLWYFFPVIFILRLLRIIPASAQQKVLLLKQEDISGMEECQIPRNGRAS